MKSYLSICLALISLTCFSQVGNTPLYNHSFKGSFNLGPLVSWSDDPDVLFGDQESFSTIQSGFAIDYLHSFIDFKIGLGMGGSLRSKWSGDLNMYSNDFHFIFEFGNNTIARVFFFDIQFGAMQGIFTDSYYAYLETGPVIVFNKNSNKANISFRPSILYTGRETVERVEEDCRYSHGGPCSESKYFLNFHTICLKGSLSFQFNLEKKK